MSTFVPKRGDLVWLDFTPQSGREQAGRRPALVLSGAVYNAATGLAVVCPVTSKVKDYPFEVEIKGRGKIKGAVLVDHVRSVDYRARQCERAGSVSDEVMTSVTEKLSVLILEES